jgi:hypothetical protein
MDRDAGERAGYDQQKEKCSDQVCFGLTGIDTMARTEIGGKTLTNHKLDELGKR